MGEDGSRPKKRRSNDLPLSDQTQAKLQRRNPVSDGGRTRTPQHSILRVSFDLLPLCSVFHKNRENSYIMDFFLRQVLTLFSFPRKMGKFGDFLTKMEQTG